MTKYTFIKNNDYSRIEHKFSIGWMAENKVLLKKRMDETEAYMKQRGWAMRVDASHLGFLTIIIASSDSIWENLA